MRSRDFDDTVLLDPVAHALRDLDARHASLRRALAGCAIALATAGAVLLAALVYWRG